MSEPKKKKPLGDLALLRKLGPYVRAERRWLLAVLLLTPAGVLLGLAQPILLQRAIDQHIAAHHLEGLGLLAATYVGVVTLGFTARSIAMYGLSVVGLRGLTRLRHAIFAHVAGQGQRFFDKRTTGALMTRTTSDVEAVYESLSMGAISLLTDSMTIVGTLIAMSILDWRLTLVAASVAPAIILVVEIFRRRLRTWSAIIRQTLSKMNGYFAERVHGMAVLQLYGAEEKARTEFRDLNYQYADAYRRSNWWDAGLYAIMDGMSAFAIGMMLWYGAGKTLSGGGVTVGLLVAFIDYLNKIFIPIREFSGNVATLQRSSAALERVFELLDTHEHILPGTTPVDRLSGGVDFSGVSFRYGEDRPDVLRGIDLNLKAGEVLAIVGATGSGKTTLGKLLLRMYDGYRGSITLDGHELSTLPVDDLHRNITVVHQDTYLFDGTVAENVGLWDPTIGRARIEEAAHLAAVHEFVSTLPGGFDARIAERGSNLSSGQKQLLAIARALARDAPLVILDEATASVDSVTERRIDQAIDSLFREKTVIVIAHRLSTIAKADRIVVLHHGRIVEQGTHDELLAAGGRYKLLVETGFAL